MQKKPGLRSLSVYVGEKFYDAVERAAIKKDEPITDFVREGVDKHLCKTDKDLHAKAGPPLPRKNRKRRSDSKKTAD